MKILILHNRYRFAGGEDAVVDHEAALLRRHGNTVEEFIADNRSLNSWFENARVGWNASWSRSSFNAVRSRCRDMHPDIVHVHNTWPQMTPSIYSACAVEGVPVVQTLHNYRLICLKGTFVRNGRACRLCVGRTPWPGLLHRCYRDSVAGSAAMTGMILRHRHRKTLERNVARFIALSRQSKQEFISAGLPGDRIVVVPNFCEASPKTEAPVERRFVYAGRLSEEKGIRVLLEAWTRLGNQHAELRILGDGPERGAVEEAARKNPSIRYLGWIDRGPLTTEIQRASAVVVPSLAPETFGLTVIEAWACARPVLASRAGSLAELVKDGETGWLHEPGNAVGLADHLRRGLESPNELNVLGRAGLAEWERKFSPDVVYGALMSCYEQARATVL